MKIAISKERGCGILLSIHADDGSNAFVKLDQCVADIISHELKQASQKTEHRFSFEIQNDHPKKTEEQFHAPSTVVTVAVSPPSPCPTP